jgi:hypothetical protein
MVSRYRGDGVVIPALGRQELHLHESTVIKKPFGFLSPILASEHCCSLAFLTNESHLEKGNVKKQLLVEKQLP